LKNILYITYDGLTDPLGQSQILPYILGLEKQGYAFTILSFEKKAKVEKTKPIIDSLIQGKKIKWVPISFTGKPPLLSKFYDALKMKYAAVRLHKKENFDMIHCRSYISADVGLYLKRRFGVKFFFDMRGFWADEKKDGGAWNTSHPIFRRVYQYYKRKEKEYIESADYIIVLTEAGKKEINRWPFFNPAIPLQVIPCCADVNLFSLTNAEAKRQAREQLNIEKKALVFSYLGSIGAWYMLDEMLLFFLQARQAYPAAKFLFITHTAPSVILNKAKKIGIDISDLIIREASRNEVPQLIKASDINISFIKPVYSKISSSPTKLGEVLSMGMPVICNKGVGDVEQIVNNADAGFVIEGFSKDDFSKAIAQIPFLLKKEPFAIRNAIRDLYSLSTGVELYLNCYKHILNDEKESISHLSLS
jgi:glycosyltransferase involved in cell wall biosynthesis